MSFGFTRRHKNRYLDYLDACDLMFENQKDKVILSIFCAHDPGDSSFSTISSVAEQLFHVDADASREWRFRFFGSTINNMRRKKYWSGYVTKHSFALDLEPGVFTWNDPKRIARSLKRSAERSVRRKASPLRSAMSMLNFYINRAGKSLPLSRRRILERAKMELRLLFKR